jgi:uncharacterized membrane protein
MTFLKRMLKKGAGRSLIKALTFRTIVLLADSLIVYTLTHRYDVALGVMFFSNISSTVLYFLHERAWARIPLS